MIHAHTLPLLIWRMKRPLMGFTKGVKWRKASKNITWHFFLRACVKYKHAHGGQSRSKWLNFDFRTSLIEPQTPDVIYTNNFVLLITTPLIHFVVCVRRTNKIYRALSVFTFNISVQKIHWHGMHIITAKV